MTKIDASLITPLPASDSGSTAVLGSKRINPQPQVLFVSDLEWMPFKRRRQRRPAIINQAALKTRSARVEFRSC